MNYKNKIIALYVALGVMILALFTNMGSKERIRWKDDDSAAERVSSYWFKKNGKKAKKYNRTVMNNPVTLGSLQAESKKLSLAIENKIKSRKGKNFVRAQKRLITARIASQVLAQDCDELLQHDPFMVSGVYNLFPEKDLSKPTSSLCGLENGQIVVSEESRQQIRKPACLEQGSCVNSESFSHYVRCGSYSRKRQLCPYPGIARAPQVKEQISKTKCEYGKNYGFDATGIWTQNKCSAVFVVDMINHQGQPAAGQFICPKEERKFIRCPRGQTMAKKKDSMGCPFLTCVQKPNNCPKIDFSEKRAECRKKFGKRSYARGEVDEQGCRSYICATSNDDDDD